MNLQNIIVGLILIGAIIYAFINLRRKIKAFSIKSSTCAADCGCSSKSKNKNDIANISLKKN